MLRRCFREPIAEFEQAAERLSEAADALLSGNKQLCADKLLAADIRALREFFNSVAGPVNPEIHGQNLTPAFEPVPKSQQPRMPGAALTRKILARDGYRCRFCEVRVVVKQARKIFADFVPHAVRSGNTNDEQHFGLAVLTASMDHIVPYARGGTNDESNLVTACGPCQYGRNVWLLEEVHFMDPRKFPPMTDDWDGLSRLLNHNKT